MTADACSICTVFLGSSKRIKIREISELLETLLEEMNLDLLEELLICDTCLMKVQSACKFKTTYLENSQKSCIQEDIKNETVCELCKESIDSVDCIPLFDSATEFDKLNLFEFLSSELQLKSQDSPQTCELCYKSILNFCSVIKSFSVFVQKKSNETATVSDLISKKADSDQERIIVKSVGSTDDHRVNIKEEVAEDCEQTTTYDDFRCKNEEIDLKEDNEPFWSLYSDDQEEKSSLPYPENLRVHANNSDLAVSIPEIKVDFTEYSDNLKSERNDENINITNEMKMFKCSACKFEANNTMDLYQHAIIHKNLNIVDMPQIQNSEIHTQHNHYLQKHVLNQKINKVKMFKCQNCQYQSKSKTNLKRHALVHENIKMFKCNNCEFQAKCEVYLSRHMLVHKNINEVKMFKCHNCPYQTKYKHHLKMHVLSHKNVNDVEMFKCQNCQYQTIRKDCFENHVLSHKDIDEIEMFKCQNCDYQTKIKRYLQRHMNIHIGKMFECQICTYKTARKDHFQRHMIIHKGIMFTCQICPYKTTRKDHLQRHNMIIHTKDSDVEIFKCQNCQYQTRHKHCLKKHQDIHKDNKAKVFKCQDCHYQTHCKRSLEKHMFIHKNINEVELFKCDNCMFETKYECSLKSHVLVHKNINEVEMFKCYHCDFQTKYKAYLRVHVLNHNKIKFFKCQSCEYQTRFKKRFKKHCHVHKNSRDILHKRRSPRFKMSTNNLETSTPVCKSLV